MPEETAATTTFPSRFEVAGISVWLNQAPPVYAPGGPVAFVEGLPLPQGEDVALLEEEARRREAVLLIVQCLAGDAEREPLLTARGFMPASSWYVGPLEGIASPERAEIRAATAADVPAFLEIGERKREQYETFSPVFWKKAPTPREVFAPYVTRQVESEKNVALVFEAEGVVRGYLIAQCGNPADGYVDDYAVTDLQTDWSDVGAALLAEAACRAAASGVQAFTIVTGHADMPKRAAVESLGFTLAKNWYVKPL